MDDIDPAFEQQILDIAHGNGNRIDIITARRMISG
jgi:hypothetical protein